MGWVLSPQSSTTVTTNVFRQDQSPHPHPVRLQQGDVGEDRDGGWETQVGQLCGLQQGKESQDQDQPQLHWVIASRCSGPVRSPWRGTRGPAPRYSSSSPIVWRWTGQPWGRRGLRRTLGLWLPGLSLVNSLSTTLSSYFDKRLKSSISTSYIQ